MSLPSTKELKRLAAACRKAGIKTFKSAEIEFTLTEEAPQTKAPQKAKPGAADDNVKVDSDALTPEELLYWSVGDIPEANKNASEN